MLIKRAEMSASFLAQIVCEDQGGLVTYFLVNLGFDRRGVRKSEVHCPATVTEVSWPSLVMLGVMNIHWGRVSLSRSSWKRVKFLIWARRFLSFATES